MPFTFGVDEVHIVVVAAKIFQKVKRLAIVRDAESFNDFLNNG